jgi:hypothetical protein
MKNGWNNSIKPEFAEPEPSPDIDSDVEPFDLEASWKEGWHRSWDGNMSKLVEMSDQYLLYLINHFGGDLDTAPLEKELKRRSKLNENENNNSGQ